MKQNNKLTTHGGNKRLIKLLMLFILLASGKMKASAEQIIATILFDPKVIPSYNNYKYSLDSTGDNIADKKTEIWYSNVGHAIDVLPNYLVKGAKIVYENKGMKNEVGEFVSPKRFIGVITKDGTFIRLDRLVSASDIGAYFDYLLEILEREKKQNKR